MFRIAVICGHEFRLRKSGINCVDYIQGTEHCLHIRTSLPRDCSCFRSTCVGRIVVLTMACILLGPMAIKNVTVSSSNSYIYNFLYKFNQWLCTTTKQIVSFIESNNCRIVLWGLPKMEGALPVGWPRRWWESLFPETSSLHQPHCILDNSFQDCQIVVAWTQINSRAKVLLTREHPTCYHRRIERSKSLSFTSNLGYGLSSKWRR